MPIKWDAFEETMKLINDMHCTRKTLPADHPEQHELIERIQILERSMVTVAELYASY